MTFNSKLASSTKSISTSKSNELKSRGAKCHVLRIVVPTLARYNFNTAFLHCDVMRRRFNNIMEYLNYKEVNCIIDLDINPTVVELFDNNDDEIFTQQKQSDAYCDLSQIKNQSVLQKALLKTKKSEEHVQVPLEKALEIAKQLQLYLSESTNEEAYYIMSRLVKAEQCSSRSSSIHVLQMEIRKTNCEWRDRFMQTAVRDWGSDTACKVLDKEKFYTCIWTGEVDGRRVTKQYGVMCGEYSSNLFGTTDYLCDRLKYSTTDMRRVMLATVKADKSSLKIYNPPEFSATISEFGTHFDDFTPSEKTVKAYFNDKDGTIDRRTMAFKQYELKDGRPVNPAGFTGIQGRGLLPRWGPNIFCIFLVTRGTGENLEVLTVASDGNSLELPKMYVDNQETSTLRMKLLEEMYNSRAQDKITREDLIGIVKKAMKKSLMVKLGFTPDALNTDNAWMETLMVQIKDKKKKHIGKVDLKSSTSKGVEWKKIDNETKQSLISTLKSIVGDENLNETSLKIKDSKKDLKTLLKAIKYGSYYGTAISGLVLVGAWITVVCTGAVVPVAAALMVFLSFAALALYMLLH
ncbi:ADP-ribose pyrophosphatase, mitochondrial [Trichinella nelsoni]|uniref:ADP-ribose pyrophosphatase, mitochondrial n=1 Tax=Trichinella nelsoni TaxID=6336 RepID=A0A0V0RIZ5_9BILA|nr:ADP-ribose pyrophosphatase, mitochondrial [Trichinella nelsoni]